MPTPGPFSSKSAWAGRIVERGRNGKETVWGVRFVGIDAGRTRVELEHMGFERLGAMARRARRGYPIGWAYVLGLYAGRKGPFMFAVTGLTAALMWFTRRRAAAVAATEELT